MLKLSWKTSVMKFRFVVNILEEWQFAFEKMFYVRLFLEDPVNWMIEHYLMCIQGEDPGMSGCGYTG